MTTQWKLSRNNTFLFYMCNVYVNSGETSFWFLFSFSFSFYLMAQKVLHVKMVWKSCIFCFCKTEEKKHIQSKTCLLFTAVQWMKFSDEHKLNSSLSPISADVIFWSIIHQKQFCANNERNQNYSICSFSMKYSHIRINRLQQNALIS